MRCSYLQLNFPLSLSYYLYYNILFLAHIKNITLRNVSKLKEPPTKQRNMLVLIKIIWHILFKSLSQNSSLKSDCIMPGASIYILYSVHCAGFMAYPFIQLYFSISKSKLYTSRLPLRFSLTDCWPHANVKLQLNVLLIGSATFFHLI